MKRKCQDSSLSLEDVCVIVLPIGSASNLAYSKDTRSGIEMRADKMTGVLHKNIK